jgi:hypothetical protein|tara:strand:- start:99 stop:314 length:216 start_codon:yes stop_codon:yes gene_type:complete
MSTNLTLFECTSPFKPIAALLNSGNIGYARVILDTPTIKFFMGNMQKVSQNDRIYIWIILYNAVKQLKMKP